jgi:hypothetical protein
MAVITHAMLALCSARKCSSLRFDRAIHAAFGH